MDQGSSGHGILERVISKITSKAHEAAANKIEVIDVEKSEAKLHCSTTQPEGGTSSHNQGIYE